MPKSQKNVVYDAIFIDFGIKKLILASNYVFFTLKIKLENLFPTETTLI